MPASPLSPAVLSKLPLGLLGFFGIKNGGQYPQTLGDVVVPTLELLDMLAANYHDNFAMSATAGGLGFTQFNNGSTGLPAIVPAAEIWYVNAVSVLTFTGAGDSITYAAEVRGMQSGTAAQWHRAISPQITQGASLTTLQPGIAQPFWLAPGDTFGMWASALVNASGTVQPSVSVQVTRFPF